MYNMVCIIGRPFESYWKQILSADAFTCWRAVQDTQIVRSLISYSVILSFPRIPLNQNWFFRQSRRITTDFHYSADETFSAIDVVVVVPVATTNYTKTDYSVHINASESLCCFIIRKERKLGQTKPYSQLGCQRGSDSLEPTKPIELLARLPSRAFAFSWKSGSTDDAPQFVYE